MAVWAIGDVQGCYGALNALLQEIGFNASRDRLWFVGDLVNRGPQSLEVLRLVRGLGEAATVVLGNHDLHLAMLAEGHGVLHGEDTLDQVLAAPDRDDLLAWLRRQRLLHVEGEYVLVHAGLLPTWTVTQARELAEEVETALQADDYRMFLANMWGSEPRAWDPSLAGWPRLRLIVNALTRLRFCTPAGLMEFRTKGAPQHPPEGFLPWFRVPQRCSADHTIVFGHWSALGLLCETKLVALDSGCLWGGALSALRLEDRRIVQVRCDVTAPASARHGGRKSRAA